MSATTCRIVTAKRVLGVPRADSVRVEADRVTHIGRLADLRALGPCSDVLDVPGGLLCAGFHEAHGHLVRTARAADELSLAGLPLDAVLARVRASSTRGAPDRWVVGNGLAAHVFGDARSPRALLDDAAGAAPVLLRTHDLHHAVLNTAALERAGFVARAQDDTDIERVGDSPTGRVAEAAAWHADALATADGAGDAAASVGRLLPALHAAGIVAFHEMSGSCDHDVLRALDHDAFPLDVFASASVDDALPRFDGRRVHLRGAKVFLDGSLGGRSAALLEPYGTVPHTRGFLRYDRATLGSLVRDAASRGLPSWIHAIGDAAVRSALDACATAPGLRHRIEHAQFVHRDDVPRFAALGIVASAQPAHLLDDAPAVVRELGTRSDRAFPLRALLRAGACVAIGSDTPVETCDVLAGIRAAVRRVARDGRALHPEHALTVEEALLCCTRDAAHAAAAESELGTLSPGRLASLTVLTHDPVGDPSLLDACAVAATLVRGQVVYEGRPA